MIAMNAEQVHECLTDVGCDKSWIARFDAGGPREQMRLLSEYRRLLLDRIHAEQKKLDCLDYLVWTVRSNAIHE